MHNHLHLEHLWILQYFKQRIRLNDFLIYMNLTWNMEKVFNMRKSAVKIVGNISDER